LNGLLLTSECATRTTFSIYPKLSSQLNTTQIMHNTIISLRSRPVLFFFLRTHQESRDDAVRWRSDKWHWQLETRSAFTRLAHLHEMGTGVEKVRVRQRRVPRSYFSRGAHHVTQFITGYFESQRAVHRKPPKSAEFSFVRKQNAPTTTCVWKNRLVGAHGEQTPRGERERFLMRSLISIVSEDVRER
jgi:hypothetical protein